MYCSVAEVREAGVHITAQTVPPASDSLLRHLIERASRLFDLACGVEPEYFEAAYYPVWESAHAYVVGDIVTPTTRNSHRYRVTTAGTSGATEPTWPTSSGGTVTSGSSPTVVTFTENGADVVASNKTIYGDGTNHLRLPPYVAGTLNTTLTFPEGYSDLTFIERDGDLVRADSNGIAVVNRDYLSTGWYQGVPIIVSAIWGFEETPAGVKQAIIEWVINLFRNTDPAAAKLVNLPDGAVMMLREKMPPIAAEASRRYRMKEAKAVFV